MTVTVETLDLTPEELNVCKDAVRRRAFFNWCDAGCPDFGHFDFWLQAEREWIEYNYVPHRRLDGTRTQAADEVPSLSRNAERSEAVAYESCGQKHAKAMAS